jgi:hypothetical protein|tara:strand:+ start:2630 stop:2923 length:294 start_codon:yes stop_codon:yes gene_type:complete
MGGAPKIIRRVVSPITRVVAPSRPPAPTSAIEDRREEVKKITEPKEKVVAPRVLRKRRRSRTRTSTLVGGRLAGDNTSLTADYSPIRNPRGGDKLGS